MDSNSLEIIRTVTLLGGAVFGLYQYWSQTISLKMKTLTGSWRKFYDTPEFMELFSLMDNKTKVGDLSKYSAKEKLKFLALLAEVYVTSNTKGIYGPIKKKAISLFQWHFYYVFIGDENKEIRTAFWQNILNTSIGEKIEEELKKEYWRSYYSFAQECERVMKQNGAI